MSDKESVIQAVEEATAQFGRIDILFNNAGDYSDCMCNYYAMRHTIILLDILHAGKFW